MYDSLMNEDVRDVNLFKSSDVFVENEIIDVLNLTAEMSYIREI